MPPRAAAVVAEKLTLEIEKREKEIDLKNLKLVLVVRTRCKFARVEMQEIFVALMLEIEKTDS